MSAKNLVDSDDDFQEVRRKGRNQGKRKLGNKVPNKGGNEGKIWRHNNLKEILRSGNSSSEEESLEVCRAKARKLSGHDDADGLESLAGVSMQSLIEEKILEEGLSFTAVKSKDDKEDEEVPVTTLPNLQSSKEFFKPGNDSSSSDEETLEL